MGKKSEQLFSCRELLTKVQHVLYVNQFKLPANYKYKNRFLVIKRGVDKKLYLTQGQLNYLLGNSDSKVTNCLVHGTLQALRWLARSNNWSIISWEGLKTPTLTLWFE